METIQFDAEGAKGSTDERKGPRSYYHVLQTSIKKSRTEVVNPAFEVLKLDGYMDCVGTDDKACGDEEFILSTAAGSFKDEQPLTK